MPMQTSKKDREKSNWRRRRNRRPDAIGDFDEVTVFKECPTLAELKVALREARESSEGIFRMAAKNTPRILRYENYMLR